MTSTPCRAVANDAAAPHQVLAAIPGLLGFQPQDSLVVVFFDPTSHIVMTARLDWSDLVADEDGTAAQLVGYASRAEAEGLALIAAGPTQHPQEQERQLERLAFAMDRAAPYQPSVLWRAHTQAGRWWSPDCIWTCGTRPHELLAVYESPLAYSLALSGRLVAPSRDAVLARLSPAGAVARRRVADCMAVAPVGVCMDEALELLLFLRGELTPADLAEIIRACHQISGRDELLLRFTSYARSKPEVWREGLESLEPAMTHAPDSHLAGIATVVAFFHWQNGDGLLASAAVGKALAADPGYRLAGLLSVALSAGLPPGQWDAGDPDGPGASGLERL